MLLGSSGGAVCSEEAFWNITSAGKGRHRSVLRLVSFIVYITDLEEQTSSTVITFTDDSELCGLLSTQEEGNKVLDNCEQASTSGDK